MAAEEVVSLRNEAMSAQQQRLELARFKIICISVLGSLAIGANGVTEGSIPYIIGLVPLVSIYIDVISETKKIQFMAIGSFLKSLPKSSISSQYEKFAELHRDTFLRNYSYLYSTIAVSAAIALLGLGRLIGQELVPSYSPNMVLVGIEICSGVLGVLSSLFLNKVVAKKVSEFKDLVDSGS